LTSTSIDIDEELLNRCLVLSVEETREQTRAIHRLQRERRTLEGLIASKRKNHVMALHRNAQRLLRTLSVVNRFARELTFLDTQIRTRRDHEKYLTMIDSLALLHQHQRPIQRQEVEGETVEYVEVEISDIEVANGLAREVLGRSLDELPPQTRRLLGLLDEMVSAACRQLEMERSDYRFTRREVREYSKWGNTQLRHHLKRLEELEYLLPHQGKRGQNFLYELVYETPSDGRVWSLPGLIQIETLCKYDGKKSGSGEQLAGVKGQLVGSKSPPNRAQIAPKSGGGQTENLLEQTEEIPSFERLAAKKAHLEKNSENHVVVEPAATIEREAAA
jgi:hypothetical protein